MRAIAAVAGVDAHLVHHYFGTKQRLFVAAMELPEEALAGLPRVIAGPPDHLGERFVRYLLELWESPAVQPLILGLVRSATSDPVAAAMLRRLITEGPVLVVARALDRPDAALRATLAGSQFVGLTMVRSIVGVEPLASADGEVIVRAIAPAIQRYLTADLDSAADGPT
jgi:AcrR family transcriptional regulator